MNTQRIEFHYDFGSPNAYLSHRVLPQIAQRTGAAIEYVPILLGGVFKATNNRSPMEQFAEVKNKPEYQRRETERFIAKHKLQAFSRNSHFPVNTITMMRGAVYARGKSWRATTSKPCLLLCGSAASTWPTPSSSQRCCKSQDCP